MAEKLARSGKHTEKEVANSGRRIKEETDMLEKSTWIWAEDPAEADSYAEFYDTFFYEQGTAELEISCDSNYAVYLNGKLAAFGQYADFEHYKVADRIDLAPDCQKGENHFAVVVWYFGAESSTYCIGKAGLIFQINGENGVLLRSGPQTACRRSRAYRSAPRKELPASSVSAFAMMLRPKMNGKMAEEQAFLRLFL